MAIFVYIIRAFALVRCCFSSSYRAKMKARWKQMPQHRVIMEVGTGIIGLMFVGALIALIIISSQK
jgi:hypothetical protein